MLTKPVGNPNNIILGSFHLKFACELLDNQRLRSSTSIVCFLCFSLFQNVYRPPPKGHESYEICISILLFFADCTSVP